MAGVWSGFSRLDHQPAADLSVAIDSVLTRPDYLFHSDYDGGYSVIPLLHPNGQTHNVALPIGVDMNEVHAANPEYHHDQEPLALFGTYLHSDGTIGDV